MEHTHDRLRTSGTLIDNPIDKKDNTIDDKQRKCSTFSGKKLAISALTVLPHIFKNIGLGALKGLELAASTSIEFLARKVENVGTKNGKINALCRNVAIIVGGAVGIVAAVPGLLIGGVVGLCRGLYKLPEAMKKSWNDSFSAALQLSDDFCSINKNKMTAILSVGAILLASAGIGLATTPGLTAALLLITSPVILSGFYMFNSSLNTLNNPARHID